MTIKELEQIEERAQRGLPTAPEHILTLTGYLRNVLQAKANAEAVASEALRHAGLKSKYYTKRQAILASPWTQNGYQAEGTSTLGGQPKEGTPFARRQDSFDAGIEKQTLRSARRS